MELIPINQPMTKTTNKVSLFFFLDNIKLINLKVNAETRRKYSENEKALVNS